MSSGKTSPRPATALAGTLFTSTHRTRSGTAVPTRSICALPALKPSSKTHPRFLCATDQALTRKLLWRFLLRRVALERHFGFRCDLVFGFRRAEQPVVEPAENVLQSLNPVPWLSGARELVRFVRENHHRRRDLAELERAKHLFAAGLGRGDRKSTRLNSSH